MAASRSSHPLKAVIFDIGGVILRLNLSRAFAPLAAVFQANCGPSVLPSDFDPEKTWAAIRADSRWRDWQEGRVTPEEWHRHITGRLGVTIGYPEFCEAWNRALDPHPQLPDDMFARLAGRFRLGLLSNTDPLHVSGIEQGFSFVEYFPVRTYSCSVGKSKPDPGIYEAALAALEVRPEEALYVDDVAEFADVARGLGMDAIRFEHPTQFAREMRLRELPAPAV